VSPYALGAVGVRDAAEPPTPLPPTPLATCWRGNGWDAAMDARRALIEVVDRRELLRLLRRRLVWLDDDGGA